MAATKKIAFTLELEGSTKVTKQLATVELDLNAVGKQLSQVKKDIDTFNRGTQEQREELLKSGKSLKSLNKDYESLRRQQVQLQEERKVLNREVRDQVKAFREVENAVPTDSLVGLRRQYKELRKEINLLSTEERESEFGQRLIKNAAKIKQEIIDIGQSVNDGREGVGLYLKALQDFFAGKGTQSGAGGALAGVLGDVLGGGALGGLGNAASSVFGPAGIAIGAVGASLQVVGGYIVDVTREFEQLNNAVGTLTGTTGQGLTKLTVDIKTVADVFEQDFNEVLRATNALTKEVTGNNNESIQLIETAFLAGANSSGQLLDNIIEYSAQIGAAGASGQEFVEILVRAEREGIFSDKGIDLVKEFGLRIREQTTATSKALTDAFGEQFTEELFDGINDGSINTVQALSAVSDELEKGELTAKQTQQVLADVFGGPGEDAGLRFIKILGDVDGNLDKLIDTTDAYTRRQLETLEATRDLNNEQQILAAQFAGTGVGLESLTTKVQAFGTSLLNSVLLNIRAIAKEFQDGNFLQGLSSVATSTFDAVLPDSFERFLGIDLGARQSTIDEIIKQDADALREVQEGEAKAAEQRRQNAIQGKASLQVLREEQSALRQEIDAARVAGEDYSQLQKDLNAVTRNLAKATGAFNTNLQRTKQNFEELAAEGSLERLQAQVRDLSSELTAAAPEDVPSIIEKLTAAEIDLATVQARIDAFKESARLANLNALPIEEQVKIAKEGIEARREQELQAAVQRTEDEKLLQARLAAIREQFNAEALNNELRQYEQGSAEYIRITNEIADSQRQLLQLNEQVSNELGRVLIDFDERLQGIDQDELRQIVIPQFDANDVAGSLEAIQQFEEQRKLIQAESELERLQLRRELLEIQGEDTLRIEQQIAEQVLTIEQQKNAKLIEEGEKRAEQQAQIAKKIADTEQEALKAIGDSLGTFIINSAEDSEKAFKELGQGILSTVIDLIAQQATLLVTQSFAQPDSVATFGASGAARVSIITGLITGASQALKAILTANLSEQGNILDGGGSLARGGMFGGRYHSQGGNKFLLNTLFGAQLQEAEKDESIINRNSTRRWRGLLSAINVEGGGKNFSGDTAAYLRILKSIKPTKYETGNLVGSSANIPMLVNPNSISQAAVARISAADMTVLAEVIGQIISQSNRESTAEIVGQVVAGLDTNNRLQERQARARQNAQI